MRVTKDRPGQVRRIAGMWRKSDRTQEAAVFTIDSTRAQMEYVIGVPLLQEELEASKEFAKAKEIAEFIFKHPGCNRRLIQEGVHGSKEIIGEHLSDLLTGGWVENTGNDRSFILHLTDSGAAHFALLEATVTQLGVG